jgi:hypothetical protein
MGVTPVAAAGVVGTGTPASCDEAAFDAAFIGGGTITFDCGPDVVGITFTGTKVLTADTTIDGGGLIAFNGNDTVRLFATTNFDLTLQGLIITDAHADDFGGVVVATNATVAFLDTHVVDSTASFGAVAVVSAEAGGTATIAASGSTFVGNEAANGGGVFWAVTNSFDGDVDAVRLQLGHREQHVHGELRSCRRDHGDPADHAVCGHRPSRRRVQHLCRKHRR